MKNYLDGFEARCQYSHDENNDCILEVFWRIALVDMDLDRSDIGFLLEVDVYLHRPDDMEADWECDQGHLEHRDSDFDLEYQDWIPWIILNVTNLDLIMFRNHSQWFRGLEVQVQDFDFEVDVSLVLDFFRGVLGHWKSFQLWRHHDNICHKDWLHHEWKCIASLLWVLLSSRNIQCPRNHYQ